MPEIDQLDFDQSLHALGENPCIYPLSLIQATWIDSQPSPMWAGGARPSFPCMPSPECMKELLHLCHLHNPDQPSLHVSGCTTDTFGTQELAAAADADLSLPLVITCLFNQDTKPASQIPQATIAETAWPLCHGDVAQWWALIECRLGDEAVPAWMIQLHADLFRKLRKGTLGLTTLSTSQLKELADLLDQAMTTSGLNIEEDFDTSPEARLLWKWNSVLSMHANGDAGNGTDDMDWKDFLPQANVPRFGVFLTQHLCDWLVEQADTYEDGTQMSDRIRNLIWGHKRFLRKSGGVLITNQHF
ncbi:MAG: hypothetical protein ACK4LR_09525 [Acidovorax temperans]|uniref:hypothetical protein n=1 Tax=Acidovorax temperans TaxID=80878 RepID=UPI00391B0486